jgi:cobalamin-dependent methionine synthase I
MSGQLITAGGAGGGSIRVADLNLEGKIATKSSGGSRALKDEFDQLMGHKEPEDGSADRAERERKTLANANYKGWKFRRVLAWVRDVALEGDIRIALVMSNVQMPEADQIKQRIVENANLARYWSSIDKRGLIPASGTNDKAFGTAFEANYQGEFRKNFLTHTFGAEVAERMMYIVPDYFGSTLPSEYV